MTGPAAAAREQEGAWLEALHLNPGCNGSSGLIRDLELHRSFGLLLHHNRTRGDAVSMADVPLTRSCTRSQARSLLSMPRLNSARSRTRSASCNRIRTAQTSLSLSGAFCPTIFPLFQGMRPEQWFGSMTRSWQLKGGVSWSLTDPKRTLSERSKALSAAFCWVGSLWQLTLAHYVWVTGKKDALGGINRRESASGTRQFLR